MYFFSRNKIDYKKIIFLIIVFIIIVSPFFIWHAKLKVFFLWLADRFGVVGFLTAGFLMDVIVQPIAPDTLIFAYSVLGLNYLKLALLGGVASVLAGSFDYFLGHFLSEENIEKIVGKKKYKQAHNLFLRHGFGAVAIGALTPLPFSIVCYSAGAFKMPFQKFFFSIIITRLPRFLLIAYLGGFFKFAH